MKFIHTADIHLGAQPDKDMPWSLRRKDEIWDSFRRLIQRAGEEAQLLLIAGDLFHGQPLKGELKEVDYLFSTIPHVQVVLMAGNHDYMKEKSYYRDFTWSENVHFLRAGKVENIYLEELDTWVTGMSYESREIHENVYDTLDSPEGRGIHILLAHGGDEKHVPIEFARLRNSSFDYIALGHIHKPQILAENKMAYAGALEPIDRNDWGEHGYIKGEITGGQVRVSFVPFAVRKYVPLEITTDENMPQSRLESLIRTAIEENGRDHYYSISLVGNREADMEYQQERLWHLGNVVHVEDYTEPAIDMERLYEEYEGTIVGTYMEQFSENLSSVEAKALHYGIWALLQTRS